jgi:hypothetical protein
VVGKVNRTLTKRIPLAWTMACLLSVYLATSVSATIFAAVNNQYLISSGALSWFTVGSAGTSGSYFTLGLTGPQTLPQSSSLAVAVVFGVVGIIVMLLAVRSELTVGKFLAVAVAGILTMIGMMMLANVLAGI